MKDFIFRTKTKVLFRENGIDTIGEIVAGFGFRKAFIVSGEDLDQLPIMGRLEISLANAGIIYEKDLSINSEPDTAMADALANAVHESCPDLIIAAGGGSVMDAAKAAAILQTHGGSCTDYLFGGSRSVTGPGMPLICIPTTCGSGSEVTGASVLTDNSTQKKASISSDYMMPLAALIDPQLHVSLPADVTAATGMDTLTHAIEAFVSKNSNPFSDAMAAMSISLVGAYLRRAFDDPNDITARSNMAAASTLGAIAFMNGGLGAVHGISQAMGGVAHVTHGIGNAVMLPHVMKVNLPGNPEKFAEIGRLLGESTDGLGTDDAARTALDAVDKLIEYTGIPRRISDLGVTKDMFPKIIAETMAYRMLAINPVELTENDIEKILNECY